MAALLESCCSDRVSCGRRYEYCDHKNNSATNSAYDSCAEAVWQALIRKNNLVFNATKAAFPDAFVLQYDRGGKNGCGLFPNKEMSWKTCATEGPHGSCDVWPPCKADGMWQTATYTLDPRERGDSLSVSLYDVAEPGNTRQRFDATVLNGQKAAAAGAQGADQVSPMIALGCGWGLNTTDGTKGDIFAGFDFTLNYDLACAQQPVPSA